ncbi:myosin-11-like [Scomber scombrus]|uniref:Myosin-11-like n=1 Tax=Scomber scombrus TaxID=13677 RepID=A0AAV1Q3D1_SCOSC
MALVQGIGKVAQNMPLDPVLATARSIYRKCQDVKKNAEQCNQIKLMVQELEKLLKPVEEKEWSEVSENMNSALLEVKSVLESANEFIKKCTDSNKVKLMVKSSGFLEEFNTLNQKLSSVLVTACNAMREQLEEKEKKLAQKEVEITKKEIAMTLKEIEMTQKEVEMDEKNRILARQQEIIQHLEARSFCVVL